MPLLRCRLPATSAYRRRRASRRFHASRECEGACRCAAAPAGLRQRVGQARILAVLEPRSNTMKRGVMKDALPGSLAEADRVYVYTSNLGWDAAAVFAPLGARARCADDMETLISAIVADARAGDHVLVMSNGGFGGIHAKLLGRLQNAAAA